MDAEHDDAPQESAPEPEEAAPPRRTAAKVKVSPADRDDLMAQVEQLLAKSYPRRMVERSIQTKYGSGARQARAYIKKVLDRWTAQAQAEGVETRRADIEAQMREVLHGALQNKIPLRNADGTPVLDSNQQPVMVSAPDRRTALRALENLTKLHGLMSTTVNVNAGGSLIDILGSLGDGEHGSTETPSAPEPKETAA